MPANKPVTIGTDPAQFVTIEDALRTAAQASQPAEPDTQAAPEPGPQHKPNAAWFILTANKPVLTPWRWMAAADIAAFTAHHAVPGTGWTGLAQSALAATGMSLAGIVWMLWRTREARLAQLIKTVKTRQKVRKNARVAAWAGTTWVLIGSTWTPVGPHGYMQIVLLGGGLIVAGPHLWRNRRRDDATAPVAELEAPTEDPRLTKFRDHFCTQGTLEGTHLHDFAEIPGGFRFHLLLPLRGVTFRQVKLLEDEIAALYDVPFDHVSVEPPESRSARRAVITTLTASRAHERDEPWDGRSTYDPATGCFTLGRYADSAASRWQLHAPGNGACGGLSIGVIGSGKTGTMNVISCEAGQARLCAQCAAAQTCPQCEMRRICALWMGDPQRQPFGVWRGRADLTAWGPVSVVRMLSWMHAGMRHRADQFGRMEWTDHLGRVNHGKGWFDPTPQFPMVLGVIDEWPILTRDPDLAQYALPLAEEIGAEGRKVGVSLLLGSQEADVDALGDREILEAVTAFNAVCHRCDRFAKRQLGLDGNPADLPPGVHGASYLKTLDRRSDIVQRTKHLPEYLKPGETGIDVRGIAEQIAADPVTYDPAILNAITELGYTGPGQVLQDDDGWDLSDLLPSGEDTAAAEVDPPSSPGPTLPVSTVLLSPHDVADVRDALTHRREADMYDLMNLTGLSALDVSRSLDTLIAEGLAVQHPSGRYAPCH